MPRTTAHQKNHPKSDSPRKLSDFERRKLRSPSDQKQAREWLREVATHLETYPHGSNSFRFIAHGIQQFLDGKVRTIEQSIGLQNKRGMPGDPESRRRMAETVHQLKKLRKSKAGIQEILGLQGFLDIDWGTVKRNYKEHRKDLEAIDRANEIQCEYLRENKY